MLMPDLYATIDVPVDIYEWTMAWLSISSVSSSSTRIYDGYHISIISTLDMASHFPCSNYSNSIVGRIQNITTGP